jgi:hypothetical protein
VHVTLARAAERVAEAARVERELGESRAQQRGREEEQAWTAKLREAKLGAWSERPPRHFVCEQNVMQFWFF